MQPFKVLVSNYRVFADSGPARFEIRDGFTALVGPNNSGKSSLLKLFHELRALFGTLAKGSSPALTTSYLSVDDPNELFHVGNDRSLSIELTFDTAAQHQVSRVRLVCEKEDPKNWEVSYFLEDLDGPLHQAPRSRSAGDKGRYPFLWAGKEILVDLEPLHDIARLISTSMYIGPFRNAIGEASGSYYDLAIGTNFIAQWNSWKAGASREQNMRVQKVTRDIAHIFGYNQLEINAAEGNRDLKVVADGRPYRLREMGSGLAQFIIVLGNVAMNKPRLVLIDEPELNLHPSLQADFLTSLGSYGSEGLIFATHSLGLARTIGDRVYSCKAKRGQSTVQEFERTPYFAEFVGEMSFAAYRELGHEAILLVEGVYDVKTTQQFLRAMNKDHEVVVIPLGGTQLIREGVQLELEELRRLSKKIAVLIDSEKDQEDASLSAGRRGFVRGCEELGFAVCVTERRAFENYLCERAIKRVKGPNYRALLPYERLKDVSPVWGKHENWRIAREMTKEEILSTDVGEFLKKSL